MGTVACQVTTTNGWALQRTAGQRPGKWIRGLRDSKGNTEKTRARVEVGYVHIYVVVGSAGTRGRAVDERDKGIEGGDRENRLYAAAGR